MIDELQVTLPPTVLELREAWAHYMSPIGNDSTEQMVYGLLARAWVEHRRQRGLRADVDLDARELSGDNEVPMRFAISTDDLTTR